jgi:hypothetical protein
MSNKFAAALKATKPAAEAAVAQPEAEAPATKRAPSRQSAKHIGGYFDPVVSKQLREIALAEDSSVQALLGEALDLLFQSRRKPMIASKSKAS